jgi:hypothetical protein
MFTPARNVQQRISGAGQAAKNLLRLSQAELTNLLDPTYSSNIFVAETQLSIQDRRANTPARFFQFVQL